MQPHTVASPRHRKTERAFRILDETNVAAKELVKSIDAEKAGYLEIQKLLEQIQEDILDAELRANSETIRIGVLGGRGSGKSTLANALMGAELLPESAIIFCTNIPTTIKYSQTEQVNIVSDDKEYTVHRVGLDRAEMKEMLSAICKESENPNNEKRITEITISLSNKGLDGKELVDVPGFTKGNPLHQAFAERYAKHYCDVCLVLLNNAESVEIGSLQGMEALVRTFTERLDSTVFIINKCDQSSAKDIKYIRQLVMKASGGIEPSILELSSKNALVRCGEQFQFQDLQDHLTYLSTRRISVLVRALLGRLITNFGSLHQLCELTSDELKSLQRDTLELMRDGLKEGDAELRAALAKDKLIPKERPEIDISLFDLPQNPTGLPPYEYTGLLVDSIRNQTQKLDDYIQEHQANIYSTFNERFESEVDRFNKQLQERVRRLQSKFGIESYIEVPRFDARYTVLRFDPSRIERLKPLPIRLWMERTLPQILTRDIRFWLSPVGISFGVMTLQFGLPIGVKSSLDMVLEVQDGIPAEAVKIINEYVYSSLSEFVRELDRTYCEAIDDFVVAWKASLAAYLKQIEMAKAITSTDTRNQIHEFIGHLRGLHQEAARLMSTD